jgi:hypothetical protein
MSQPPEHIPENDINTSQPFDLETYPLDKPASWADIDWGGDGSNLSRPVRAHVLAALVPTDEPYPEPVDALRHLGRPEEEEAEQRRSELGLTQEHVPDLVRMARDRRLNTLPGDIDDIWAPIHALHALKHLDISQHIEQILTLFDVESDWHDKVLTEVLASAGAHAMEPTCRYLQDETRWSFGRTRVAEVLAMLVKTDSELRPQAVETLSEVLQDAEQNDEVLNSFLVDSLVELEADEKLPVIRHAFETGRVDEMVRGDWATVLDELGYQPEPDDPLVAESARRSEERREQMRALIGLEQQQRAALTEPTPAAPAPIGKPKSTNKVKQKRKQEKASRKANRPKNKKKKR